MTSALRKDVYLFKEGYPAYSWPEDLVRSYHIRLSGYSLADDCMEALMEHACSLLVVGLDGKPATGLNLLAQSSRMYPRMLSIAVVSRGDVPTTVAAMRRGVRECVEKPTEGEWWLGAVEKAATQWQARPLHSNGVLTETEKFVLAQVVAGKTSREIGEMLHRSPRTVEVHRTHILQKLGVSGTVGLIRKAVVMELADSPPSPSPERGESLELVE